MKKTQVTFAKYTNKLEKEKISGYIKAVFLIFQHA